MKRLVNRGLGRLGYEIRRRHPGLAGLAGLQSSIISQRQVDAVIDVGANAGQFGRGLRAWGYEGVIVSFEPLPSAFAKLSHEASGDTQWECRNLALGPSSGNVVINEARFTSVSSLLSPTSDYHRFFRPDRGTTHEVSVRMERLGDELETIKGSRLFLKTDTQGFDLEVIRSASDLSRVVAIQCELAVVPLYHGTPTFTDAVNELGDLGFAPAGFFPVVVDSDLRLVEVDGVFVRAVHAEAGASGEGEAAPIV